VSDNLLHLSLESTAASIKHPSYAAVLLCGGRGSRVSHITERRTPKCLLSLSAGVRVLDLVLAQLAELGVDRIYVAGSGYNVQIAGHIERHWGNLSVETLAEPVPGTLSVLLENSSRLSERFWLVNADTVYLEPVRIARVPFSRHESRMGVGYSWIGGQGNIQVQDRLVTRYDKAGFTTDISDSGWHLIARADLGLGRARDRLIEDRFLGRLIGTERVHVWHSAVLFLDLGTESSLNAARVALTDVQEILVGRRPHSARAHIALHLLRTALCRYTRDGYEGVGTDYRHNVIR